MPGLHSKVFPNVMPGKHVLLVLDNFDDGMCCEHGRGFVKLHKVFPVESGRDEELRWSHDVRFLNAAGTVFFVDGGSIQVDSKVDLTRSSFPPYSNGNCLKLIKFSSCIQRCLHRKRMGAISLDGTLELSLGATLLCNFAVVNQMRK